MKPKYEKAVPPKYETREGEKKGKDMNKPTKKKTCYSSRMNIFQKIAWWYGFHRLYKNGRAVSLIKAVGGHFGMRVYLEPPAIAPGIFARGRWDTGVNHGKRNP